ncbi:hypothetical protein, partial [Streptococcus equi]
MCGNATEAALKAGYS